MAVNVIDSIENLDSFIESVNHKKKIKVFGSGFICNSFFDYIEEKGYIVSELVDCILVSSFEGNESPLESLPLRQIDKNCISDDDTVFIAVSYKNASGLTEMFSDKSTEIYYANFSISNYLDRDRIYRNVKTSISEYLENYSHSLQAPKADGHKYIWTCWWQGIENAPDIVKACIESQKANIPKDTNYIIITEKNYKDYIDIPDYIIEKVNNKFISLTTLSDIIRFSLLHKYGGLWIDSTVLLYKKMPSEWLEYDFFTCKGREYHFASYSEVSLWFIGGKAGNELFSFVREAFLNYYQNHNKIKYYLMVDYLIKLGFDTIPGLLEQYSIIPYNNENADVLKKHLHDKYEKEKLSQIIEGSFLQKLTYKFQNCDFSDNSIYNYIITQKGIL